nr:chemotaxis protein CheB [Dissulfurirhabdus thermomarina]
MRKALVEILSRDEGIEVVGVARHGQEALEAIEQLRPDVVTMDVDMPVMDGLTAVKHIMVRHPLPVVMLSGLGGHGGVTLEALRLGAVDFFPKPSGTISLDIHEQADQLLQVVKQAARVNSAAIRRVRLAEIRDFEVDGRGASVPGAVVIGAQQGSAGSLIRILDTVTPRFPIGLLVVQELSPPVLKSYAGELQRVIPWRLRVGEEGPVEKGACYVSSYDRPLALEPEGEAQAVRVVTLTDQEGALDGLFSQAAGIYKDKCLAILLGGAGMDGVEGLRAVHEAGGRTLVLKPEECVHGEASEAAIRQGVVDEAVMEHELPERIEAFGRQLWLEMAARKRRNRPNEAVQIDE